MSVRRLKQIRRYLTEHRETHERVDVQKALKLLDQEIEKQDRSSYFKKYYQENKDIIIENHKEYLKQKNQLAKLEDSIDD